jgi:hypothetical protein
MGTKVSTRMAVSRNLGGGLADGQAINCGSKRTICDARAVAREKGPGVSHAPRVDEPTPPIRSGDAIHRGVDAPRRLQACAIA